MLCHERKRMKPRDACIWEINPPPSSISTGWMLSALVQKQDFLPEMKSLQHQNNQEAASLSHCIAKEIISHEQPIVTAKLFSIFCARTILNREQHWNAKQIVLSVLSASTPQLHPSQHTAFSFKLSSSQASMFPIFPPRPKISGFSWTWKDFFSFLQQCHYCIFKSSNYISQSGYLSNSACEFSNVPLLLFWFSLAVWWISHLGTCKCYCKLCSTYILNGD